MALRDWEAGQRRERPLIGAESVDLVISNCVLNLVNDSEKQQLVSEIFRVLKPGGRVAISDIISDRPVPQSMKSDPGLWSGCISGAFGEEEFLQVFADSGFHAACYDRWDASPWQVVGGIEFRSVTLTAVKPASLPDECSQSSVLYRGPFAAVTDDAGNCYPRGRRVPVDGQILALLTGAAYNNGFIGIADKTEAAGCCGGPELPGVIQRSNGGGCC
jgi:SAM-dependent methyltransferase